MLGGRGKKRREKSKGSAVNCAMLINAVGYYWQFLSSAWNMFVGKKLNQKLNSMGIFWGFVRCSAPGESSVRSSERGHQHQSESTIVGEPWVGRRVRTKLGKDQGCSVKDLHC